MAKTKTIIMPMSPKYLFRSITGFKYQLHQALGDLADNCVDADCTRIWISVSKTEIIIADNGNGMSFEEFRKAITPWASNDGKTRKGKRGVYGIGLKSAAFSLGEKLEVHTKSGSGDFQYIKLNHDELIESDNVEFPYSDEETKLFKQYRLSKGTVIRISNINTRKVTQPAIDKLKGEIGLMFFKLIENNKISILINDEKVEPLHPLLLNLMDGANPKFKAIRNGNAYASEGGDPGNYAHDYKKKKIEFLYDDKKANITMHAVHIGRGTHWSLAHQKKYRYFLRKNVKADGELETGLLRLDDQGIYLMRNDRLITLGGGWFGIHRQNTLLHHDVSCRVLIEYNSEDDKIIGVDHTKTKPDFLTALKDAIRDQYLQEVLKDSEVRFRQEGNVVHNFRQKKSASEELKSRPRTSTEWSRKSGEAENAKIKSDPAYKKKIEKEEQDHEEASKKKVDWLEIVEKLPFDCLWSATKNKDGKTIVSINENHPGYTNFYDEYSKDKLRKNLNLFFYYMGQFEVDVDSFVEDLKPKEQELLKKVFKDFRKFVSRQIKDSEDP